MAGVDITTVKELLVHKTLTMTLRYAHLAPSHKVKAVDILDETINKKSTAHFTGFEQCVKPVFTWWAILVSLHSVIRDS